MVATTAAGSYRAPIWPLIVAPLVAIFYYIAVKAAFQQSMVAVLGNTATTDIDLYNLSRPQWGSHWFYRGIAEAAATGVATFIAAGLAHGRERLAAIIAGCTISLGFLANTSWLIYAWNYMEPADFLTPEPWYQYAIDVAMIFAPPIIGAATAETAQEIHDEQPNGFAGINRLHFCWLWIAAFWYALGLIGPMARIYALGPHNFIAMIATLLINAIPAAVIAVPGYYGLAFLAGNRGDTMHPVVRNLVGVLVLIFGLIVGGAIQYGWFLVMHKIWTSIFG